MKNARLSVRIHPGNPTHHLWNNNGTWFIHYTVHHPDFTKDRVRHTLGTKSLSVARRTRDLILHSLGDCGHDKMFPDESPFGKKCS